MRKTISLLLCVLMTLALFCVGISAAGGTLSVEYQIGTINAADGLVNTANKTRLHSPDYIPLADAEGVTVKEGYQLAWLAYGKDKNYLGNGNDYKGLWQPNGGPIRSADILALYPDAVYFRFGIRNAAGTNVSLSDVEASGVTIVAAGGSLTGEAPEAPEDVLGTTALPAEYQIGTINAADGLENTANTTRLFNPAYIPLADALGVQIKKGYQLTFVMRDADQTTRAYSFDLPDPTEGTVDPFLGNIPVVTLEEKDILTRFDGGYSHYMQGATVLDGLIYSLEGFTNAGSGAPPAIRVFDTRTGTEAAFVDLYGAGFTIEPEFISVYQGTLYYSDANGKLLSLQFN